MKKNLELFERGKFKEKITTALYKDENIRELILGETSGMSASKIRKEFREHVKSHLFIDDTIEDATTFIFYDVKFPYCGSNIKKCEVIMYPICHRDILDDYSKEGYYGNRSDILTEMIVDRLINDDDIALDFGIGRLKLENLDIYNSQKFYGCILTFSVPDFAFS